MIFKTYNIYSLPAVLLEDLVQVPRLLLHLDLGLDLVKVELVHEAEDEVLLLLLPLLQYFLPTNLQAPAAGAVIYRKCLEFRSRSVSFRAVRIRVRYL